MTNKPDMHLYAVAEYRDGKETKKHWTRIGAAWKHGDGQGYSIKQQFVPVGGEFSLVLRTPLPDDKDSNHEVSGSDIPFA